MAQKDKAAYWKALKDADARPDGHYRDFTTEQLRELYAVVAQEKGLAKLAEPSQVEQQEQMPPRKSEIEELREQIAGLADVVTGLAKARLAADDVPARKPRVARVIRVPKQAPDGKPAPRVPQLDPTQHAGVTQNTHGPNEVLETDEFGNQWYRREVRKPSAAKPRGRRVLEYNDTGIEKQTVQEGRFTETFEVAGTKGAPRQGKVKITLPSYQTGIMKSPALPFKIRTYNGARGFDMDDVQQFYGGADLVPDDIKKIYVGNDLTYDIQSTRRALDNEYRERVLKNGSRL